MNKHLFPAIICFSTLMSTPALADGPVILNSDNFGIMPGIYASDGKNSLYFENEISDRIYNFTVYDENFSEIKQFSSIKGPVYEREGNVQRREYAYKNVIQQGIDYDYTLVIDDQTEGLSINRVLDYAKNSQSNSAEICTLKDGRSVVGWNFWQEYLYGSAYPMHIYIKEGNVWMMAYVSYEGEDWGPYGPYGEVETENDSYQLGPEYIALFPENGGDYEDYHLTHGIFSDDYNYVIGDYGKKVYNYVDDYNGTKRWGTESVMTGLKIYSSNGNVISSITFPSGYYTHSNNYLYVIKMGDKLYLMVGVETDESDDYYIVYKLDKNNSSVTQVAIAPCSKISPRTPRKGENVIVSLDPKYAADGCMVNVISTDGRVMLQKKVEVGQTEMTFNTSNYPQGLYIVRISGGVDTAEVAKIIVR